MSPSDLESGFYEPIIGELSHGSLGSHLRSGTIFEVGQIEPSMEIEWEYHGDKNK